MKNINERRRYSNIIIKNLSPKYIFLVNKLKNNPEIMPNINSLLGMM